MDAERWRLVRKLLDQALDLPADERTAFVAQVDDAALREDLARMLSHHDQTTPLDQPAAALAAQALAQSTEVRDWDRQQIGRRIGPFVLDDLLGAGGMGTVYRAHRADGKFEQTVAIKLVLSAHPGMRERFRKEQEIVAGLRHPNIAQLIDGGEADDGIPYLAMEYVEGVNITQFCRDRMPDVASRVRLMLRVAGALSHAHRNLVIHRDIKPSNILVTDDGHPILLDFGIAKLVGEDRFRPVTEQRLGPMTPAYAAPEQFRGGLISVATDVYQFGVLLFRVLTGRLPYSADPDDAIAWGRAVIEDDPITLGRALTAARKGTDVATTRDAVRTLSRDINRDLDAIVRTALQKDPTRRYSSIDALAADLEAFLDGRPVQARHGDAFYFATRFIRRHRIAVAMATLFSLSLIALTSYAWFQAKQARREAERAQVAIAFINDVFRAADPANGNGQRPSAEDILGIAAEQLEPKLKGHPELRAPISVLAASAYANMGAMQRAHELFARSIPELRQVPALQPLELARVLERAAFAAQRNGDLQQSQQWWLEAEKLAIGDSAEAFNIRDGLSNTRFTTVRESGDRALALTVAEQSLAQAERAPAEVREAIRNRAHYRVGIALADLGRFDEAERQLKTSYALARKLWGDDHFRTLRARGALGWFYTMRGDPVRGLAESEPVAERFKILFGEHSQDYGNSLYNMANAYSALQQHERAIELYRSAAGTYAKSASSNAGQIGWALWNAGILLNGLGHFEAARTTYEQVAASWQQSIAADSPVWTQLRANIAANELALKDYASAAEAIDRVLVDLERRDPESESRAEALLLAGKIAEANGNAMRALLAYDDAVALLEKVAPARQAEIADLKKKAERMRALAGKTVR